MRPRALGTAVALALCAGGCSYAYRNPADDLRAGQIAGRAVSDPHGAGVGPAGGVTVTVKGSAFDIATHPTGRFALLPLPVGRHTVVLSDGVSTLQRDVDLGFGRDGQPEGVDLGDVRLPRAAAVSGTATPPVSLYVNGVVVDEASGTSTPLLGHGAWAEYRFAALAPGAHRLWLATGDGTTQYLGGPLDVTVAAREEGTEKTVVDARLHAAAGTGNIRFHLGTVGVSLAPADVRLVGLPAGATPTVSSSGDVEVTVPEGAYFVGIAPPATSTGVSASPVVPAVVVAGETAELGTLYLVLDALVGAAQAVCLADADCATSGTCQAGACGGSWRPPAVRAPANLGLCVGSYMSCAAGTACTNPFAGGCVATDAAGLNTECLPCGTCCTPDGSAVLCGVCSGT
jgi:hypothetical protein